jgi:hypothetical protein
MLITTDLFKPPVSICTMPSLLKTKIENRIQISLLDKLQKFKISLKVTQMAQNTKVAI